MIFRAVRVRDGVPILKLRVHFGILPDWFARDVLLPFVLTRVALTLIGLSAAGGNWLGMWTGWDGGWYLDIARAGYIQHAGEQSNTAFAPALPLVMHVLGLMLLFGDERTSMLIAGVIAANVSLLVALGYLVALTRFDFEATARRAALYGLVFPSTLFLSAVYPHSLFLAGAIAAFYYARRGSWWLVGCFAAVAALARAQGLLIILPLAFEYLRQCRFDRRRIKPNAAAVVVPLIAGLAYAAVLFLQVGAPMAMLHAGAVWGRQVSPPWAALLSFVSEPIGTHGSDRSPLDLAFTLLLIVLVGLTWRRLRASLAVFASLFLLISLSSGLLVSSMRYGLELFPIYIVLAISGRHRLFHYAYIAVAGYLALRFMMQFAQGVWVA
jgi:hypothetical protein